MRVLFIFFILGCALSLHAQTQISAGNVSGTWTKSGSPYKVNGDIVIPDSQTLFIEPGVVIEFAQDKYLKVYGNIVAKGKNSPGDSIWFMNLKSNYLSSWKGIKYINPKAHNDSSFFEYCVLRNCKSLFDTTWYMQSGALMVSSWSKMKISNCSFYGNESTFAASLCLTNGSKISISNCLFRNNKISGFQYKDNGKTYGTRAGGSALTVERSAVAKVEDCVFKNAQVGTEYGSPNRPMVDGSVIHCFGYYTRYSTDSIILERCKFENNGSNNIDAFGGGKVMVNQCDFINRKDFNTHALIYSRDYSTIVTRDCYFYNNLCGQIYSSEAASIYSYQDLIYKNDGAFSLVETRDDDGIAAISNFVKCRFLSNECDLTKSLLGIKATQLSHCLVANNITRFGFDVSQLYNNTIINNKCEFANFYFSIRTNAYVKNNILWNNKNDSSTMRNIIVKYPVKAYFYNNIIEGDSIAFYPSPIYQATKPQLFINTLNQDPLFKNPTPSYGASYDALQADFSLVNTCQQQSPCINAGYWDTFGLRLPYYDLKGNKRFYEDRIDIGAYEDNLGSAEISVLSQVLKDSFCHQNRDAVLSFRANGMGLSSNWQKSTDNGNSWITIPQTLDKDTLSLDNLSPEDNQTLYRAILVGTCDRDTTESSTVHVFARPELSLGEDTALCVHDVLSKNFTEEGVYLWHDGSSEKYRQQMIDSDTIWQLTFTDKNQCSIKDTLRIEALPVPEIDLGADRELERKESLVLDAGSGWTSYLWSDGSSGQVISFKGEDLGDDGPHMLWAEVQSEHSCTSRDSVIITVVDHSNIDDLNKGIFKLYPNPVRDILSLELDEDCKISIYTLQGVLLETRKLSAGSHSWRFSETSNGILIVRIASQNKLVSLLIHKI